MSLTSILSLGRPDSDKGQGQVGERVVGTRTSGPSGIESVIEYNGLFMNVREWSDTYLVTGISGIDDADVRDSREENPTDDGETAFAARYGGRTIVLTGKIETKTLWKLRDMQSALRQAFSDISQERPLIFRTPSQDTDLMVMCRKSGKIEMGEEQTTQNKFERAFQITLRASNPRFVGFKESVLSKKWGYMDSFAESSPTLVKNEVLSPRGAGSSISGWAAYTPQMAVTAVTAPAALLSSGTALMSTGTIPASQAALTYPGLSSTVTIPGTAVPGVTSFVFSARFLWTAIAAASTSTIGLILRWRSSANPGAGVVDTPVVTQANPTGFLNAIKEGMIQTTVPALTGGVAPNNVEIICYATHPVDPAAGTYTVYLTDVVLAFNTTTIPTPFDGDSLGAFWVGAPYASASVKYQAYINEFLNPSMASDYPDASWSNGSGITGLTYDDAGGLIVAPATTGFTTSLNNATSTLRNGDTFSMRWTLSPAISGIYRCEMNNSNNTNADAPDNIPADIYMEAGKKYTFYIENALYTSATASTPRILVRRRNAAGNAYANFVAGENVTISEPIFIRGRVQAGSMSGMSSPIVEGDALASEWIQSYNPGNTHNAGGKLYLDNINKQVWVTHKNGTNNTANRSVSMKIHTPPSMGATTPGIGVMSRQSGLANWLTGVFTPTSATAGRLSILMRLAGVTTTAASGSTFAVTADTDYVLNMTVTGNIATVNLYNSAGSLRGTVSYTLTAGAQVTALGAAIVGDDGIYSAAAAGRGWVIDEFTSEPTVVGPVSSHAVINSGDYPAQPIIRIYGSAKLDSSVPANAGGIAVSLVNETNGEVLAIRCKEYTYTAIAADRYLEIDIAKKTMNEFVASTGALVGNAFDRLDPGSDWLTLEPGKNLLTTRYFLPTGQPRVDIRWRRTHM